MGVIQQSSVSSAILPMSRAKSGLPGHVVGHARHPAGQLLAGEEPHATLGGGDDELHGREPVAVEDEHQVGLQHVEDLGAQLLEPGVERALVPVVQLATKVVG